MSLLRTLARNLASMSVMRLGSALIAFLLFWFLARGGDAAFLGAYAFLLGVFAFLQQLPLLGLHLAVVRDAATDSESTPTIVANLGMLGFLAALLLGGLCATVGLVYYPAEMHMAFLLVGCAMLPTAWVNLSEAILVGRQEMGAVAGVNLVEATWRAVASAIAFGFGAGLTALFVVFLAGRAGAALYYYWFSPQVPRWQARLLDWPRLRSELAGCPVFFGIMVLSAAISRFDVFFLSRFGSLADVGVYAVAAKIYEAALMAPSVIAAVLYPAFSRAADHERPAMHAMLGMAVYWVFLLALPCAVGVALLAQPLIAGVFGTPYAAAAPALQVLMGALVLVALNQILTLALLACHEQRSDLNSLLAALAAIVFLLALLIPVWGMLGAAWAVFGAMLVQLVMRYVYLRLRVHAAPGFRALWRPGLAGLSMLTVGLFLEMQPRLVVLVCAFIAYGLTLFFVGGVRSDALRMAAGLLRAKGGAAP